MTDIHPQIRAILDAQAAAGIPPFATMAPRQARALMLAMEQQAPPRPLAEVGGVDDLTVESAAAPIPVRRYRPKGDQSTGRLVYFHGGGWVVGTLNSCDPLCRALVAATGFELLSVDYRLAPEAPFPAAVEDAKAVIAFAAATADGLPVFVGGDSAGGNLAAVATIAARDAGGPPIAGQILLYPVTDHDLDRASYQAHGDAGLIVSRADMGWFWGHYVTDPGKRADPLASPLRAAHHGNLPPAFVAVGGYDPLHDEGVAYAEALERDGSAVTLRDYPDMVHGFCSFVGIVAVADAAVAEAGGWAAGIAAKVQDFA